MPNSDVSLVYKVKVNHGGTLAKLNSARQLDKYLKESALLGQKLEELTITAALRSNGGGKVDA